MQTNLKIIMLGASGAVGGFTAHALCDSPEIKQLTLLNRRTLPQFDNTPKAVQPTVDVLNPQSYAHFLSGHDTAVCCLGVLLPTVHDFDAHQPLRFHSGHHASHLASQMKSKPRIDQT